jgi:dTDP-4-amino-4,6-dideoxygalactose transaminase
VGGTPVFADTREDTYNIDPKEIERKITDKTKAIISVDFAGQPADLDEIHKIAQKHNLIAIEDASHALGAEYKINKRWIRVGNCIHSDMAIFSFHPVKPITTGEGGMVVTNNKEYYEKLLMFRTHGITKDYDKFANEEIRNPKSEIRNAPPWYYEMQYLGFNYRITDFQCALGISQLKKLDKFIHRRREIVEMYNEVFKNIEEIIIPYEKQDVKSGWHIYVIRLKLNRLKTTRREMFEALRAENIGVQVHYIPVYYYPYYQKLGYKRGLCPNAERYYEGAITLPLFPKMSDRDVNKVIVTLKKIIHQHS